MGRPSRAGPDGLGAFERAQARFLDAASTTLEAGDRHFDDPSDERAAAAYRIALLREREAARDLEVASARFFRSRRA